MIQLENNKAALMKNKSDHTCDAFVKINYKNGKSHTEYAYNLMPNEETVVFIDEDQTSQIDNYSIDAIQKHDIQSFSHYETDSQIDITNQNVSIKFTKDESKQTIQGEVIIIYYHDNEIVDIEKRI